MQQKPPLRREQKESKTRLKIAENRQKEAEAEEKEAAARARSEAIRRDAKKASKSSRSTREEELLQEESRRRHLKEAQRAEREERRKSRAAYRATHPGFYNPALRLHSVLATVLAILALFFFASFLFKDGVGTVGSFLAYTFLGGFSFAAYLIPIFMTVHAICWHSDVRDRTLVKKALAFLPMLVCASALAAMLTPGFSTEPLAGGLAYERGVMLAGGGAIGEFVARTLCRVIGPIGLSLISIAVFLFFFALYFRVAIKHLYISARAHIKAALVERAKRRATAGENDPAGANEAKEKDPIAAEAPSTSLVSAPVGNRIAPPKEQNKEEIATARRRALFADLEGDLEVDRDRLPSGNRGKQLFDYESAPDPDFGGSEDPFAALPPFSTPEPKVGGADFSGDRLTVTRERIRPVRVSKPTEPKEETEDHTGMDYFRRITVAATREEEEFSPEAPHIAATPAQGTPPSFGYSGQLSTQPKPITKGTPATPIPDIDVEEPYDSFADGENEEEFEGESLIVDVPRRSPTPTPAPKPSSVPERAPAGRGTPSPSANAKATPPSPKPAPKAPYRYPPLSLLALPEVVDESSISAEIQSNAEKLVTTLDNFKVRTQVTGYSRGPRITRYEIVPEAGVRVRTIAGLVEDISMSLATSGVRIETPIPGKSAVGVEVPNAISTLVRLRGLLDTPKFRDASEKTLVCLGSDVTGQPVYCDLAKMPHMLVAGATGMGKSVCINSIITSILYKATPEEVKLIMIDPKQVEFAVYSGIPHLLVPVVTDPKKAAGALSWAVNEMERRFALIKDVGVRDSDSYNREMETTGGEKLPKIIVIIDELADLMLTARDAVETSIARIAAKARAAGIHLLIGTQRPSVDVITGTIKSNIPSRIAFHVSSNTDSRTILDFAGAEKLLPRGDMLFNPAGAPKPYRLQGAFVDDKGEISRIVAFLKENNPVDEEAGERIMADIEREAEKCVPQKKNADEEASGGGENVPTDYDDQHLLWAALEVGFEFSRLSTSLLQRKLKIGYGKAAKILDELYERDYITAPQGSKPREIRITREEFKEMMAREVEEVCGGDF